MAKVDSLRLFLPLLGASLAACGGGAAAAGGAAPPSPKPADSATSASASKACPDGAIEDAEDNDGKILVQKERGGYWFTYADDTGSTISPPGKKFEMTAGGASGSKYAARMSGKMATKGDSVWAGMGFNLADPKKPYNATAYKGISFQGKIGAGSTAKVYFSLSDANTDPEGKVCKDKGCWNHFGAEITLTDKWAKYTIPFAGMTQQPGWGDPRPPSIDASKVFAVQWGESTAGASFDVWVDDVQFVCE
jgi:hypothetical protein